MHHKTDYTPFQNTKLIIHKSPMAYNTSTHPTTGFIFTFRVQDSETESDTSIHVLLFAGCCASSAATFPFQPWPHGRNLLQLWQCSSWLVGKPYSDTQHSHIQVGQSFFHRPLASQFEQSLLFLHCNLWLVGKPYSGSAVWTLPVYHGD